MIEIANLRKTYKIGFWRKPVIALKGVSLEVRKGDLYGFIGPNGAGKSTTIKIILGLLNAGEGEVKLMGKAPSNSLSRLDVGFLPEQPYFYDYLSGYELLHFYGSLSGLSGSLLKTRIQEAAEKVKARPDWLGRKLRTYSKGMLQRMGLAQVLLSRPKLVILDEPMSGLDPVGRRDVRLLLQDLHAEGTTIFYSSHVLGDVEAICTKVAMIVGGEIRRQGTVDDVIKNEVQSYVVTLQSGGAPVGIQLPPGLEGVRMEGEKYLCESELAKKKLIRWACDQNLDVSSVDALRSSLEDVLTMEMGRV